MATVPFEAAADTRSEARFFFVMACAMAATIVGGFSFNLAAGRSTFAVPLLIPYAWHVSAILLPLIFPLIGVLADKRRHGAVHPAWLWGIGIFLGLQVIADLIAYHPLGNQFTELFLSGTPGAARQMEAFVPPM